MVTVQCYVQGILLVFMTISQLKVLAIVTMVIDHIGLFFFPHIEFLRIIGRLAFPIFAWLIANGAYHTRDIKKYIGRLSLLAVVSQLPFALANGFIETPFVYLNVVFTLVFGLGAIYIIRTYNNLTLSLVALGVSSALAHTLNTDYGAFGVFVIVAFYVFYQKKVLTILSQTLIFLIPTGIYLYESLHKANFPDFFFGSSTEIIGLISLIFILSYDNKKSLSARSLFYYFYPAQYVLICLFQILLR